VTAQDDDVQKPVGPFDDFEGCVRHFEDDPEVDDPEALCGWMENNKDLATEYDPEDGGILSFVEELKEPNAESVLADLSVSYVSGVGNPAIDSQWVYAKDADEERSDADWGVTAPLVLAAGRSPATVSKAPESVADIDFGDYPDAAVENARMALDAKADTGNPNDCGTQVGWERANQLDNGEDLTEDTVARMAQFARHEDNYDPDADRTDCGWMMWKAWGGTEGIEWAQRKMDLVEQVKGVSYIADLLRAEPAEGLEDACWDGYVAVGLKPDPNGEGMVPDCVPEDEVENAVKASLPDGRTGKARKDDAEQKAWAPVLIPNEADKQGDVIPADEIEQAAHTFLSDFRQIDTDHDLLDGKGEPIESWTLKEAQTFTAPDGTESREYPAGTWMMGVKFADEAWERVVEGELTGFSIYGEATELSAADLLAGEADADSAPDAGAGAGTEASASTAVALAASGSSPEPGAQERTMSDDEHTETDDDAQKMVPPEGVDAIVASAESYVASGGSLEDGLDEWMEWGVSEMGDFDVSEVEVAGETITPSDETEAEDDEDEDEDEDEDDAETDDGEDSPEDVAMSEDNTDNADGGADGEQNDPSLKEMVSSVKGTVEDTRDTVTDVQDRVDDLEAEVFGKDEDGESEPGTEAETGPSAEDVDEAVEEKMADILGVEKGDLPEDDEERNEVIRKHIHETTEPETEGGVNPDEWTDEDFADLTGGN
jgi:hypothetical protein